MSTRGNPFSDSRSGDLTVVNIDLDKAPTPTASPTMVGGGLLVNDSVLGLSLYPVLFELGATCLLHIHAVLLRCVISEHCLTHIFNCTHEGPKAQPAPNRLEVIQSVAAYSACSATMLLINKMVMHEIPLPSIVSVIQFASSCLAVAIVHGMGKTEIERFRYGGVLALHSRQKGRQSFLPSCRQDELNKYLIYVAAFVAGLFCNMRSLQLSNVETVCSLRSIFWCWLARAEMLQVLRCLRQGYVSCV